MTAATHTFKQKALKHILWLGLATGTLDGLAALILNYQVKAELIFRFIAGGAFGKAAFSGGVEMVIAGVIFHYLIAYVFTAAFYLLYPYFKSLFKNVYVIGALYGLTCWLIMNLGVVPASKIGFHTINMDSIITGMAVLIVCVGLPIAVIADAHLKRYTK